LSLGPHLFSPAIGGHPGQLEVHLLFEGIHLRHLHLDLIPQLEHPPGAASDKLAARRVKLIEVVAHPGERH